MKKLIVLLLILVMGFASCKNSEKQIDKIEISKQYFKELSHSDDSKISNCLTDSITIIEGEYKIIYSKKDYLELLKWDAVFSPNYKILEIEEAGGMVKVKISKIDKRIAFLQETPFIMHQTIKFQKEKIISIETEYLDFKEATWERNKNTLISWIDKNHPELNGFIYDQTESGGMKFLKAIALYKNRK
ncbi:hypothetical protein [Algibacter sp. L3A6]|uniref:hypothetical protein n=1 Tax=Algibacter sp. L3A6 TaxID=2686366 RepID=UPI00131D4BF1|nr:hypothetical protein [Algibacter sp. L3A6]